MIPKTLHLYWGNQRPLSYLRHITVASFALHNPDWEIFVHVSNSKNVVRPSWPTREHQHDHDITSQDWLGRLGEYASIVNVNDDGLDDMHDVQRSDVFRWRALSQYGGVWSDFDIVYVAPIGDLINMDVDASACVHRNAGGKRIAPIGFLAGARGNELFDRVHKESLRAIDANDYQSAGRKSLEVILETRINHGNIDHARIYPVKSWHVKKLFTKQRARLDDNVVGVHWYGGYSLSQDFESRLTPTTLISEQGLLALCARRVMRDINA